MVALSEGISFKNECETFKPHLNLGLLIASTISALVGGSTGNALITHIPVHGEVLQSPPLCLRDEQGGEDTSEHEGREDLHDMVQPRVGILLGNMASGSKGSDSTLSDDGANLS